MLERFCDIDEHVLRPSGVGNPLLATAAAWPIMVLIMKHDQLVL